MSAINKATKIAEKGSKHSIPNEESTTSQQPQPEVKSGSTAKQPEAKSSRQDADKTSLKDINKRLETLESSLKSLQPVGHTHFFPDLKELRDNACLEEVQLWVEAMDVKLQYAFNERNFPHYVHNGAFYYVYSKLGPGNQRFIQDDLRRADHFEKSNKLDPNRILSKLSDIAYFDKKPRITVPRMIRSKECENIGLYASEVYGETHMLGWPEDAGICALLTGLPGKIRKQAWAKAKEASPRPVTFSEWFPLLKTEGNSIGTPECRFWYVYDRLSGELQAVTLPLVVGRDHKSLSDDPILRELTRIFGNPQKEHDMFYKYTSLRQGDNSLETYCQEWANLDVEVSGQSLLQGGQVVTDRMKSALFLADLRDREEIMDVLQSRGKSEHQMWDGVPFDKFLLQFRNPAGDILSDLRQVKRCWAQATNSTTR
ncbi:hypothetical protein QBC35DRAFT_538842 [Podospora australis]|uniref:Uncharacterized protein n=1 Tax=Podospora australis TaxID=1536484 RepID=A0AAN7AML5_9PEZI|nr:hypothetical protein QBC35DRAFT_538842 [Podospora australis]